jgi:hypothetical protein
VHVKFESALNARIELFVSCYVHVTARIPILTSSFIALRKKQVARLNNQRGGAKP